MILCVCVCVCVCVGGAKVGLEKVAMGGIGKSFQGSKVHATYTVFDIGTRSESIPRYGCLG